jgi:hypothetical protein
MNSCFSLLPGLRLAFGGSNEYDLGSARSLDRSASACSPLPAFVRQFPVSAACSCALLLKLVENKWALVFMSDSSTASSI